MMELLFVIVQELDLERLSRALIKHKIQATKFNSEGLYLNKKNITLMICINKDREEEVLGYIKENCTERTEERQVWEYNGHVVVDTVRSAKIGGATVFITPLEKMVNF